jgi:outer membrane protein OmpA-like peptidoglycan-associated protein
MASFVLAQASSRVGIDVVQLAQAQPSEQERAKAKAAQQQAATRAAQQQAAARAAQQAQQQAAARAVQQQAAARAAQQQAAARAAQQQRQPQEQAAKAAQQQRQAQEQARAAQQRQAQERAARPAQQQRQPHEQAARAAQERQVQERAAQQQRQAQERARSEQQRHQAQERVQQQPRQSQERAPVELQQRQAQEQQRQRDGARLLQAVPNQRPGEDRPGVGQDWQRMREEALRANRNKGEARRAEIPSRQLQEVQRQRQERSEAGGGRDVIREPDRRVIVKERNRTFIRHDENQRLARSWRGARSERRGDGTALSFFRPRDGSQIFSEIDADGRALRRYRRARDGREIALFDDRRFYGAGFAGGELASFVDLPPPVIDNSQEQYIVDYSTASEDDLYAALIAPPVEALERDYSLEEIRLGFWLRERMRRVDLPDINFELGSWEIAPDQYPKLERLARVIKRILDRRPDEVFLVEGHTDVVDSDIDNLTLSDRRAEAVAFILSQMFGVPAENLVTQGYGGQYLKAETGEPAGANRRVTVRRITPLLHREGPSVALGPDDRAPPGTSLPGSLALSDEDRAFILANVDLPGEPRLGIGGISEGMPVPGGARLRSFPSVVRERIPTLEAYKYFVFERDVAIVDPRQAVVVAVVEGNR